MRFLYTIESVHNTNVHHFNLFGKKMPVDFHGRILGIDDVLACFTDKYNTLSQIMTAAVIEASKFSN